MKYLPLALFALSAVIFLNCSSGDPTISGGGDEFPNTKIIGLGKILADNLSSLAKSSTTTHAMNDVPDFNRSESFSIIDTVKMKLLQMPFSRVDVNRDTIVFDTINDTLYWYATNYHGVMTFHDTLAFIFDSTLYDTIEGNESVISAKGIVYTNDQKYYHYHYGDGDLDQLLFNPKAALNIANLHGNYFLPTKNLVSEWITINAGTDNNFETAGDNQIYTMSSITTVDSDTNELYFYLDADNDGISIDNLLDSCIIDLYAMSKNYHAPASKINMVLRIVVFPEDSLKNHIISLSSAELFASGKKAESQIIAKNGLSTFYPGDTVYWNMVTQGSPYDSVVLDTTAFEVVLGPDPVDSTDDGIMSIYSHAIYQIGDIQECYGYFRSHDPIKNGYEPDSGTIEYRISFLGNFNYTLTAYFSIQYIEAYINDVDLSKYYCQWDRKTGELLKFKKLP